jgi:hypothetical protein
MFDRQRGQMSVRHEVAVYTGKIEDFTQQLGVPLRRLRGPCRFTGEPSPHLAPGIDHRLGIFEHARICHEPAEMQGRWSTVDRRAPTVVIYGRTLAICELASTIPN